MMFSAFSRSAKLKQWIAHPNCPAFLKEFQHHFDIAFSTLPEDFNHIVDSAFSAISAEFQDIIPVGLKVAVHVQHLHNGIVFSRSKMHIGNSPIMYYPNGNRSNPPIPAEIGNIVIGMDQ